MNAFVKLRQKISPYLFLVPCLIVFGLFLFYPFAKTIYLSLYKTDKLGQAKLFVGFGNYIDLFTSESFYNSLLVTLIFVVIVVMVAAEMPDANVSMSSTSSSLSVIFS